ncbi:MAG TPA: 30S ribosome-binding factor RbfA [Clostridia bacterium]|nr:30S ribosome-binding factor RbfA [Clostridia bacterium]
MSYRTQRVTEEMKREIAAIIKEELKDPRVGFVTVTGVEITPDYRYAKVFVSVYGSDEEVNQALEGLEKASGFIRKEVGRRIKLRYTPELSFRFDESIRHGAKIAEILADMQEKEGKD